MMGAEFDRFAVAYRELHALNIAITGEAPDYFAAYKMRDFAARLSLIGAPESGRFLDFGSGVGASVRPFLHYWPRGRLVCADVSKECLEESARIHGNLVDYIHFGDGGLPIEGASVDGAFACCVFHHIPPTEHRSTLAELRRVLKAGAPLMVYEHNPYNPLTVRAVRTCPLDENALLIRAHAMRALVRDAGFQDVRVEYRVFFPAALRALRPLEPWLRWLPLGAQYAVHAVA
jgi:SAM-dependent methyltransferase